MSTSNVSVGTVVLFGGDLSQAEVKASLIAAGWLPCDGASYAHSTYAELFKVIGIAHGGDSQNFNVPNMIDHFARGTDNSANIDPDVGSRTAAAAGGATRNNVGSYQPSGTAVPKMPWVLSQDGDHFHAYQHLNTSMHEAWCGSTDSMARWSSTVTIGAAGGHFHTMTGGDLATIPINIALYWVIRAKSAPALAKTPAAALSAYGASVSSTAPVGWLYCNGQAQVLANASPALSSALGSNFGGDGVTVFRANSG